MKFMTGNELRNAYLEFFKSKDHLVLPSYSLIPENDPTLLMIGAGMAPFKPFFTGKMKPPHTRISTSQKCVRTGDIENVGRTARHHTFFEMLGNFSFGDYFKVEAITWAWEFLTEKLELPIDKLWVTIHPTDDEAYKIWTDQIGVSPDRVVKLEDHFWEIGPGPCGPCSEIYIDLGEERGCGSPDCAIGCDCDRYLEIWNLVFTQFDRDEEGNYTPLEKKNIDTGAGLERIASVLQNKPSNFETDLVFPIIAYAAEQAKKEYGKDLKTDVSLKVIGDHARSMTIMISDGILPSNEGRGYVLRRIIRRAIRHGRLLGINDIFLAGAVDVVVKMFGDHYTVLKEKQDYIRKIIQQEEERFQATLAQGIEVLEKYIADLKAASKTVLDGELAFKLYDTFGFPWELTAEILEEQNMSLDKDVFDQKMEEQRTRARAARQENQRLAIPDLKGLQTENLSYNEAATESKVVWMWTDGENVQEAHDGQEVGIILSETSFYAEGGGQIGDAGMIVGTTGNVVVETTKKLPDGTIYHVGYVQEGVIRVGDEVKLQVELAKKRMTACNHTATHLLQAALKRVVGSHINQAGSAVDSERLRFDFSHFEPVTAEQLAQVEAEVNDVIRQGLPVTIELMSQEEAKAAGAMALFGEKYGDVVRVVSAGDYSKALCGGTHVTNTMEIGMIKIISEAGVAAGTRRIEALTGQGALRYYQHQEALLKQAAAILKTREEDVPARIEALIEQNKATEAALHDVMNKMQKDSAAELLNDVKEVGGVKYIIAQVEAGDMDGLRNTADMIRDKVENVVVVLGAVQQEKVSFVVMADKSAVKAGIHAGNIIKEVAKVAGGGGGGRPDMAQAGGKQPAKIGEALAKAEEMICAQIG